MKNIIGVNEFVKRQIAGSGKTYALSFSFEEICLHAQSQMNKKKYRPGYRDGVVIVEVDKNRIPNFVCPLVKIKKSTKLVARYVKRQLAENSYIQIR